MRDQSTVELSTVQMIRYALLALPVAVAGLPISVQIPHFYSETIGINLTLLGIILFATRAFDVVQDPLLGAWSDRLLHRGVSRMRQIGFAVPLFCASLVALVMPVSGYEAWWLASTLIVLYAALSFITVNYYALGAAMGRSEVEQTRTASWREGLVLVGIVIGSVVPSVLANHYAERVSYPWFMASVSIALIIAFVWARGASWANSSHDESTSIDTKIAWKMIWHDIVARRLFVISFANTLANALPSVLVLYYIGDVIGAKSDAGWLLGIYFLSGIIAIPFWQKYSARKGAMTAWCASMMLAAIGFVGALFLGAGDVTAFAVICVITGICVGADLIMPSALLSQHISRNCPDHAARYFGVWHMLYKAPFAIAAGVALPILAWAGYSAEGELSNTQGLMLLSVLYAGVPSFIKATLAIIVFRRYGTPESTHTQPQT